MNADPMAWCKNCHQPIFTHLGGWFHRDNQSMICDNQLPTGHPPKEAEPFTSPTIVVSRGGFLKWVKDQGITKDLSDAQVIRVEAWDSPCPCCGK